MLKIKNKLDWNSDFPKHDSKYVITIGLYNNQILMVLNDEEKRGREFPGGEVEIGEKIETAAIREFYEETGLSDISGNIVLEIENEYLQRQGLRNYCYVYAGEIRSLKGINRDCELFDDIPENTTFSRDYYSSLKSITTIISGYQSINRNCWNNISGIYKTTNYFSKDDFHYGPMVPGESQMQLLGDLKGKKILDLGCGLGHNSCYLAQKGGNVTAIDFSENQIDIAKNYAKEENTKVDFQCLDINNLCDLREQDFDLIVSIFAFQFIQDTDMFFNQLDRLLKDNGTIILSLKHPDKFGEDDFKINMWDQDGISGDTTFIVFKHAIDQIIEQLQKRGFNIINTIEPLPVDDLSQIPYYNDYYLKRHVDANLGKYTLIIKAKRCLLTGRT